MNNVVCLLIVYVICIVNTFNFVTIMIKDIHIDIGISLIMVTIHLYCHRHGLRYTFNYNKVKYFSIL